MLNPQRNYSGFNEKFINLIFLSAIFIVFFVSGISAQYIQVHVAPDHSNWVYKPNEKVKFKSLCHKKRDPSSECIGSLRSRSRNDDSIQERVSGFEKWNGNH